MKLLNISFIIILLLGKFLTLYAQSQEIVFADSTQLHCPPWEGHIHLFSNNGEGMHFSDPLPNRTNNQAYLNYPYNNGDQLSWSGSIKFDFSPSTQNYFLHLLYPICNGYINEEKYTDYVAVGFDKKSKSPSVALKIVRFSNKSADKFSASTRHIILQDEDIWSIHDKNNHIDYAVTFDLSTKEWELYVDTHGLYNKEGLRFIGKRVVDEDYSFIKKERLYSSLLLKYSKNYASNLTLLRMGFYTHILSPTGDGKESPSIITNARYEDKKLILICRAVPDISEAVFQFKPSIGISKVSTQGHEIILDLAQPLTAPRYILSCRGIRYPNGEVSPPEDLELVLENTSPDEEKPVDIDNNNLHPLFSEIMPYPDIDGSEYIELFNNTNQPIDLQQFGFVLLKEGHASKVYPIRGKNAIIQPEEYKVVTRSAEGLYNHFDVSPENICVSEYFPVLPNNEGHLVLLRLADSLKVETLPYNYSSFCTKNRKRGFSLERISFSVPASDTNNWHAASQSEGYGTPGKKNSIQEQAKEENTAKNKYLSEKDLALLIVQAAENKNNSIEIHVYTPWGKRLSKLEHQESIDWASTFIAKKPIRLLAEYTGIPAIMLVRIYYDEEKTSKKYAAKIIL